MTKKIIFLNSLMILTLFFSLFLGFNNGNVFAIADSSYTFNFSSIPSWFNLCTDISCSDYAYIHVEPSGSCSGQAGFFMAGLASANTLVSVCSSSYYPLRPQSDIWLTGGNQGSFDGTVTITFKDSLSSPPTGSISITENGTFDVSSYATATVDVPQEEVIEDPISNDFQKVFFKIVEKIIPAFGIILVVWFGIDILSSLIFGRGR